MTHMLVGSGSQSPDNVATPQNSSEMFLLESCNLNVIGGANATVMTFGYSDQIAVEQGGTETIYDEGHGLSVSAQEATTPTLVDIFGAWQDQTSKFTIFGASGPVAPTITPDHHGGSLVTAGNVTFDLMYDGYVRPGQFAGLTATHG